MLYPRVVFSHRVPGNARPNSWATLLEQRRNSQARLIDLTEANPTRVGLSDLPELGAWSAPEAQRYDPDPRGLSVARRAIAGYYGARGIEVDPDQVVLCSGTSEAYAHLFRLLCDPGEGILIPRPSYPLFEPLADLEGVAVAPYPLRYQGRWRLDRGALASAVLPQSRAVVVVQPHHPTGSCLDAAERQGLEALCLERGLSIIADEVFGDFGWSNGGECQGLSISSDQVRGAAGRPPLPSLLGDPRVPTFVMSGLSKVCGMPQLKLSWVVVAGPAPLRHRALEGLEWIADLFLSVSTPVQHALPELLEQRHAYQSRVHDRLETNRLRLATVLERSTALTGFAADGGWVAILALSPSRSEEQWVLELLRRDVVVHPGHFYDFTEEPLVVVSLIVPPDLFAEGIDRLATLAAQG